MYIATDNAGCGARKQFSLDMSFDEALGRFVQTDPDETLAVQNEDVPEGTIDDLIDAFEACAQTTDDGIEYWLARDLQKLLDYAKWEKFEQVIGRAMTASSESGKNPEDHFVEVFPHVGKNPR